MADISNIHHDLLQRNYDPWNGKPEMCLSIVWTYYLSIIRIEHSDAYLFRDYASTYTFASYKFSNKLLESSIRIQELAKKLPTLMS